MATRARATASFRPRGMTLVEVVVVALVSTVIMAAIGVVFVAGRSAYFTTDAKVSTREQIRQVFDYVERDLQDARIVSFCADAAGNTCNGGLASSLTLQMPQLADANDATSFYDTTTSKVRWDTTNPVTYEWARGAGAPPAPTALYRCVPLAVPPNAGCQMIAPRVTLAQLMPMQPDGATSYASPTQFYTATWAPNVTPMPALVDVTIQVAPAPTETSSQVPRFQTANPFRIRLRNIQQ